MVRVRAVVVVLLLAGCSQSGPSVAGPRDIDPEPPLARMRPGADKVLARWDRAAGSDKIVVFDGLGVPHQLGDCEPAVADNNKRALMAGRIETAAVLPAAHDQPVIRLDGGHTHPVTALPAAEVVDRARRAGAPSWCGDCRPLLVTGARPIVASLDRVGGGATGPAWEFQLDGSAVRLVASAVPDSAVTAFAAFEAEGRQLDQQALTREDRSGGPVETAEAMDGPALEVTFSGAPGSADRTCGADYAGEAVESERAVVVLTSIRRTHFDPDVTRCPASAGMHHLTIPLHKPLADRVVLQLGTGLPITG